ncbi:BadF/BadG/BcrA/BcrD ATPase family protein [Streptomyces albiaxialis]|uniref:BadF/BadG/BcrA/BcrD ATPase family protein n=1 Tax=Streptomyces albiaxialis TaxID=329523 RepID=A0ABN2WDT2_9ACTN
MGLTSTGAGVCVAVDAGNSKTDVAVLDTSGRVLGAARGGGFQPPTVGVAEAVGGLERTVLRAAEAAGASPADFAHVSACLANADLPSEERALESALRDLGWGGTAHVANDTFAILRAGLPDDGSVRHGAAVVCGAGINCVGRAEDGRTHRFPAVGHLSGDWGGGSGLASEALWHAARAADGRGAPTALARVLPAHFGLPTMYALIEALHLGELPMARKHEITPLLFACAREGDPVALSLVHQQADEIVSLAVVTLSRLDLLETASPVFLGGGVVTARHPELDARLAEQLALRAPKATAHLVTAPPVLGAALLALDQAEAPRDAHARVREHYA